MIFVNVNDEAQVTFGIQSDVFYDVIEFLKRNYIQYNPDTQKWVCSSKKAYQLLDELGDIDTLIMPDYVRNVIERQRIPVETKFVRRPINKDLMLVPPIVGKSPYENYQYEDFKKGLWQNRMLFAHEMGLGKTWVMANILQQLFHSGEVDKLLIVSPPEGVYNWLKELLRFSSFVDKDEIEIASRYNRKPFHDDAKVVIMSYRTFLTISDDYYYEKNKHKPKGSVKKYRKPTIPFDEWGSVRAIVLDESHKIKNRIARQTHVLKLHKDYFDFRYLASGTPHPNGIEELFSQMKFLDEGSIQDDDFQLFLYKMAILDHRNRVTEYREDKVNEFIQSIDKWYIRRMANDCLNLPELYVKRIYVPMLPKQRPIYQGIIQDSLTKTIDLEGKTQTEYMIDKFSFISLAIDNPSILKENEHTFDNKTNEALQKWKFGDHSKLEALRSIVESHSDEKVIIWSGHPSTIDSLAYEFKTRNPVTIYGGLSEKEKDDKLTEFRLGDTSLLIASYKVVGTSINLIESATNIYFDRSWNLEEWLQSVKRTHRIGQIRRVLAYVLIVDYTLDVLLDRKLEKKESSNRKLLSKDFLTTEEWKDVFQGVA